jgi:hypothetical protein
MFNENYQIPGESFVPNAAEVVTRTKIIDRRSGPFMAARRSGLYFIYR